MADERNPLIQDEAQEAKSPKKLAEEKLSRKRIFFLIVGLCVVIAALVVWEIVELFL